MKFTILAALLNLAAVQATAIPEASPDPATLDADQLGGYPKITHIKPKYRSTAKRDIVRYAAFTLKAKGTAGPGSMDPKGQAGILSAGQGMCAPCTLLSAHYRLVHPNGTEATPKEGVYIHHIISFLSPKTSSSPIGGGNIKIGKGAYFIDRGEDSGQTDTVFTSSDGKYNSGYQLHSKPSITLSYDLVNYQSVSRPLHLEIEYEYVDGIQGKDAGHTLKSVTGSPRTMGRSTSMGMKIARDTTIMWARGHLHAGGVSMTMKINGKERCVSKPTYDSAGVITNMSLCPDEMKLKAGDTMTIESYYDTTKHKLRQSTDGSGRGAHGALGGSDVMGMIAMSYTT